MKHTKSKAIRNAYRAYEVSTYYTLHDCYGTHSPAKERAFARCLELMRFHHGRQPRILGFNTMRFSFGFIGIDLDTGKDAFFYITRDYDRFIYIDELNGGF